jgi:hypothetical protein
LDTSEVVVLHTVLIRWPFHTTLFMTALFGVASGGIPNFVTLASLIAMTGFGLTDLPFPWFLRSTHNDNFTGLVPVDSAILLGKKLFVSGYVGRLNSVLPDYRSARDRRTGVGLLIMTTRMAGVLVRLLTVSLYIFLTCFAS